MEILDHKSSEVISFFTELDEMLDSISQALKNRTPHLNGEKFLTNKDICQMLHISNCALQEWRDTGIVPFIQIKGKMLRRESEIMKNRIGEGYAFWEVSKENFNDKTYNFSFNFLSAFFRCLMQHRYKGKKPTIQALQHIIFLQYVYTSKLKVRMTDNARKQNMARIHNAHNITN
ncbi:hypothetical protein EZS27_037093 [termite gut metagenome]|uniref:Helix-turn-helix domain-containing protein n=1 Tax=termite gut metagenome TaxID=433724 RepID=A0A5J4PQS7_9ZZZZ